jgi:hypothetical protein
MTEKTFAERLIEIYQELEDNKLVLTLYRNGTGLFLQQKEDDLFYFNAEQKVILEEKTELKKTFTEKIKECNDFKAKLIGLGFEVKEN